MFPRPARMRRRVGSYAVVRATRGAVVAGPVGGEGSLLSLDWSWGCVRGWSACLLRGEVGTVMRRMLLLET
jgi:hypothetical protein